MKNGTHGRFVPTLGRLAVALAFVTWAPVALAGPFDDPAFGREWSAELTDASLGEVFEVATGVSHTRFLPQADVAALRTTVTLKNVPVRTVLELLATNHELVYVPKHDGIAVYRRPRPAGQPVYELTFWVRHQERTLSHPAIPVPVGSCATIKQGVGGGVSLRLSSQIPVLEEHVAYDEIQLVMCIEKEAPAGLELLGESSVRLVLDEGRRRREESVIFRKSVTCGAQYVPLARWPEPGYEVQLAKCAPLGRRGAGGVDAPATVADGVSSERQGPE